VRAQTEGGEIRIADAKKGLIFSREILTAPEQA